MLCEKAINRMEKALMVTLKKNTLDLETYLNLRRAVGWKQLSKQQARRALDNSLYNVVAYVDEKAVAMGRVVGDGSVICYVQDLIVLPDYQGMKIGTQLINNIIDFVKEIKEPDTEIMLCLMCAKGRERFYEGLGFIARPTDALGPGMIQYIK